ncbi:TlpA family protein disulfide reductase [Desulfobulbus oligotrophicus]|uniref:TlpA family protein disulfide reductase n=1 Tax=Desulfobulbus oligotrophicus TaxID=1909699 RepID=A0A7T5VC67_9BACT|nr:TlpA disulfide reductase family protein [Desulfobulbus oligotrophicus]QQG65203.1 TlpA family protein disulfide reductase [Desulfobulbus oligotrophicus]
MNNILIRTIVRLCLLLFLSTPVWAAQVGEPLIPFKGIDLNGESYDLQDSIGTKPIMLVFWTSWCQTCKSEVPKINALADKFQQRGMEFVAVNVGFNDTVERAQNFVRKTGMTYRAYFDGSGTIAGKYGLQGVPTIIIADRQGIIQFRNFFAPNIPDSSFVQLSAEK